MSKDTWDDAEMELVLREKHLRQLLNFAIVVLIIATALNFYQMFNTRKIIDRYSNIAIDNSKLLQLQLETQNQELNTKLQQFMDKFEVLFVEATAYAPFDNVSGTCNNGDPNHTATGVKPTTKTLAVDPAVFPYGTKFFVPGHGVRIAEDTGGAMRKRTKEVEQGVKDLYLVDICMDTHQEAIQHGRKIVPVIKMKNI